jgi:hypothetical protein
VYLIVNQNFPEMFTEDKRLSPLAFRSNTYIYRLYQICETMVELLYLEYRCITGPEVSLFGKVSFLWDREITQHYKS